METPRVGACACEATGRTNLVAKNQERHIDKLVAGHQTVKLGLGFLEARTLERVHEEHDAVDGASSGNGGGGGDGGDGAFIRGEHELRGSRGMIELT